MIQQMHHHYTNKCMEFSDIMEINIKPTLDLFRYFDLKDYDFFLIVLQLLEGYWISMIDV